MRDNELLFGGDFFDLEESIVAPAEKLQLREGELREVAVLFADIKGFSSISNLFDAETIHKKMDELMKVFSRCISYYGGFVDKYMGDGIMALFGAKIASEQDTERAIMAALKMKQQLRQYNRLLNRQAGFEKLELGIRIGINSGLVSVGKVGEDREGDFTVYGPEVNLASRMESNAPVNEIMLPVGTMKQVQRSFEFEAIGQKSVKGFDEPIDCFIVVSPKLEASLHRRNHQTAYIGRTEELALLQNSLTLPDRPQSQFIHIKGDAGLGKTRLVYEFERHNTERAIFLHGACSAISHAPLNLFSSILESFFRIQLNETPEHKLSKLEHTLGELSATLNQADRSNLEDIKNLLAFLLEIKLNDPRLKQSGADLLKHLSLALISFFKLIGTIALKQHKPLVLVLDDLHWLDEASASVLESLVTSYIASSSELTQPKVLWMLLSRMEYELPPYLSISADSIVLSLSPLRQEDIRTLLRNHVENAVIPEEAVEKVITLSEGNPFYLEEWCNYIDSLPKSELKDFPVPATLHALVLSRLDKLPVALKMLLHKASVIGQDFFVDILQYMEAKLNEQIDVVQTLNSLEEQSIILKSLGFDFSTYFFKHITTREVAYQTLLLENRKILHRLCAEAIEELYPERLEEFTYLLAERYHQAEITDKAAHYLEKAGNKAANIYDNSQALKLYAALLSLPRIELAKQLEIKQKVADIHWLTGDREQAIAEVESIMALAESSTDDPALFHAHRFLGIASFYTGSLDAAKQHLDKAMFIANKLGDTLLNCIAMGNLSNWYFQAKDFAKARELQLNSLELAEQLGDPQRQAKSLSNLGMIDMSQEAYITAEAYFTKSLEIARTERLMKEESIALGNMAYLRTLSRDFDRAKALFSEKLRIAEMMYDLQEEKQALENLYLISSELDDYPACRVYLQRLLKIHTVLGNTTDIQEMEELLESLPEGNNA